MVPGLRRAFTLGVMDDVQFSLHLYRWHYIRFLHFIECLRQPEAFSHVTRATGDADHYVYSMLHVEAIAAFLTFLEMLPIYLVNLRNMSNVQMALHHYNVSEAEKFYANLTTQGWEVTHQCLGYDLYSDLTEEMTEAFTQSAQTVHSQLLRCGAFYLKFKGLLNAFKHGMRIVNFEADHPMTLFACFPDRKDERIAMIVHWTPSNTERMHEAFDFLIPVLIELFDVFGTTREMLQEGTSVGKELLRTLYPPFDFPEI